MTFYLDLTGEVSVIHETEACSHSGERIMNDPQVKVLSDSVSTESLNVLVLNRVVTVCAVLSVQINTRAI